MSILCILIIDLYTTDGVHAVHVEMKVPACSPIHFIRRRRGQCSSDRHSTVLYTVKRDVSYFHHANLLSLEMKHHCPTSFNYSKVQYSQSQRRY